MDRVEVKQLRLADMESCGQRGYFIRRPGESRAAQTMRLLEAEAVMHNGEPGKVLPLINAMMGGEKLPPVIVVCVDGNYTVVDGWHRSAAAGALGRETINAIVCNNVTDREADLVSELAFHLSEAVTA